MDLLPSLRDFFHEGGLQSTNHLWLFPSIIRSELIGTFLSYPWSNLPPFYATSRRRHSPWFLSTGVWIDHRSMLHTLPCVQETITQRHPPRSTSLHCSMEVYNLSCKRSALRWAYVRGWVLQATTGGPVVLIHGPFLQHHCFLQEQRNLRLQMRDWHLTRPRQRANES